MKTKNAELKFITPYLPYGVTCEVLGNEIPFDVQDLNYYGVEKIKLILKPLSDYYDINCPEICKTDLDIPTQLVLVDLSIGRIHYSGLQVSDYEEFLRLHIDIFRLIEKDQAHSINDFE